MGNQFLASPGRHESHSEVWSSSQPAIRNSSSSKRSSVSFGLLKRKHEEKPTILNSSSSKRSPVFGLLINHEEEAARKTQEEKLRERRYNKCTAEMIVEYERDQEKEAKKSRPERDKWKKPFNKEATRSYLYSRSNGVKPSSPKKAVQKPQSRPVVETPSTRTEEKRNKGFEKWLESFKARIHQKSKDDLGPIFDEEEEPFGRWTMDDDLDPIFDEEEDHLDDDLGPIFDEEDDHLDDDIVAGDVVDSGPEADHEKYLATAYASGDILGSLSSVKLVQLFVCKEYDPVELLRLEEAKVEEKNVSSFILEGPDLRTNPFKRGGDDVTQISSDVSTTSLRYKQAKQLIIAWLNGHFMGLIGLIHEVLDREKLMGLMQNDVSDQLLVLLGRHGAVGATITDNPPVMFNVPLMLPFENYDKTTKVRLSTNSNGPCETTMVNLNGVGRIAGLSIQQRRRRIKNAFSGNMP
ncbi:hypothetical protein F2Q68_00025464 [Brassica cretica]|uniref:Uncharacterized protein n=1 Tax=Brassica cretica TaxID=69181 RepID=A0A8S9IBZ3_BRACR|nr:hypothetical protein F2Q68_00025464 [Brassica cretica]